MTVAILNAMWIWNDYLLPYLVIGSEYKTISVAIQYLRGGYGSIDLGLMMAIAGAGNYTDRDFLYDLSKVDHTRCYCSEL